MGTTTSLLPFPGVYLSPCSPGTLAVVLGKAFWAPSRSHHLNEDWHFTLYHMVALFIGGETEPG